MVVGAPVKCHLFNLGAPLWPKTLFSYRFGSGGGYGPLALWIQDDEILEASEIFDAEGHVNHATALGIILPKLNPPIQKENKNVLKPQVEKGCEKDDGKGNGKARDRSNFSNRLRHSDPVLQKQINNIKVNYLQPTHIIKKCIPARTPLTQRKIRQRTC